MKRPAYYGNPAGVTEDVDIVRAIYDAFARRDLEAALVHIAPDCELHLEGTARLAGRTEPYRGHDGMREYLADVARIWDQLTIHPEDYRVVPGSVIVIGHISGLRDGEPIRRAAVWTWRISDGRAVSVRVADMGNLKGQTP